MKKIVKIILFCIGFLILLDLLGKLLKPSCAKEVAIDNDHYSYEGIYDLPKGSLDVVFVGSSHAFCSISPEDIFSSYGITSYVLGSGNQRIWQSYFNLKDVFRIQSPKVVIVESLVAFEQAAQGEAYNREAIDRMKLSWPKIEAIKMAVAKNSEQEHFLSYIFPAIRYHDRWEMLEENDFSWFLNDSWSVTKGYLPRMTVTSAEFNISEYEKSNPVEMNSTCREYLTKIKELCDKNQAELILTKFPTCLWNGAKALAMQQIADEMGVIYLDFCADEILRRAVNIDWSRETLDNGNHLNYDGALKVTDYMGKYLEKNYVFSDKRKNAQYDQWKKDYAYFKRSVDNYYISMAETIDRLVEILGENYSMAVSIGNIELDKVPKEDILALNHIGVQTDFVVETYNRNNFIFVSNGAIIAQRYSDEQIDWRGNVGGNYWRIESARNQSGNVFHCFINEKERAEYNDGINIIVWDDEIDQYVSSLNFVYEETDDSD